MSRDIRILSRARTDVNHIYSWLETRSPRGAAAWYQAFWVTASKLGSAAESCPLAPEAELLQRQLREAVFKTRRGRRYRIVFELTDTDLVILRVRGPGQPPLRRRDSPAP